MTTRDRLNEIIALCQVALSELDVTPAATPVTVTPPTSQRNGLSNAERQRAYRARRKGETAPAPAPAAPVAPPPVDLNVNTAPDLTPEGRAFAAYQQCAALNGWPVAPPLNAHVRFLLQQRVADVGLGGFTMALTMAANAAFLREADRKTAKAFVTLQWLAERDNFERITEGKWEKVHPPGKIDPVVPSTPPEIERAIMRGDA